MTTDPVLRLEGVEKRFGRQAAVSGLDLDLAPGEFLTLLGPSGSGKTTALMLVAGLLRPDAGRILLRGRAVERLPPHRRDVGVVFQSYALFPHMSVRRNVLFPLEARGVGRAEAGRLAGEALAQVGLDGLGERLPRELSGGQQQRVALARAMVFRPALLLMDEPLGALDRALRGQLQAEIVRVHRERATPVLFVTHDQEEALAMSDRIAVFRDGRVEQAGAPAELYERPRTRFVAGFLGATNLLPATVLRAEGERCAVRVLGRVLEARAAAGVRAGEASVASVRPERVALRPAGAEGWPGVLAEATFLGEGWRYAVRLADGTACQARLGAAEAERAGLRAGGAVSVWVEEGDVTVFPGG